MGPLVPEIIGNELNLVVAIFIGIAFGFVLEQAGFSTSKKLVGLFYGYDFTVLRVFFTAGLVAMVGVVVFDHFGIIDISLIYINPTFLWSAIVGGLIMGMGFVVGGFCPGTSVCAAAIGKIDAMIFIAGSFIGVYSFAEGYPLFEGLYKAASLGNVRVFDTLNMSQGLFAFLLIIVAVGSFWLVTMIENKVNKKAPHTVKLNKNYVALTVLSVIVAISMFFLPQRKETLLAQAENASFLEASGIQPMDVDELAFRLIEDNKDLQIIDLRSSKDADTLVLPKAVKFTFDGLFEKEAYKLLNIRHKINVFVAQDEATAKKGAALSAGLGFTNNYYLAGGLKKFKSDILNFQNPAVASTTHEKDTYRFRTTAAAELPAIIYENKLKQSAAPKKQVKRVLGGC